jgi:hypothetical protein
MPSVSERDIGIYLVADVSVSTHVMRSVAVCRGFPPATHCPLIFANELFPVAFCVTCFVAPRLQQCDLRRTSGLLVSAASVCHESWSAIDIRRWQDGPHHPLLCQRNRLRAEQRVSFKVTVLAYQRFCGVAPSYLFDSLHLVADMPGPSRL